jgi:hypothetical protein
MVVGGAPVARAALQRGLRVTRYAGTATVVGYGRAGT